MNLIVSLMIVIMCATITVGCVNTQTNPTPGPGYPDKASATNVKPLPVNQW
jgi:hypothetical protein